MGNCQSESNCLQKIKTDTNQGHLIDHYDNLGYGEKRDKFQQQLLRIDFNLIQHLFIDSFETSSTRTNFVSSSSGSWASKLKSPFIPIPSDRVVTQLFVQTNKQQYDKIGGEAIQNGEVGVILMSGRQGLNIGFEQPLGTYDIGLISACSIFQVLVIKLRNLLKICKSEQKAIKLYIMTNEGNKEQIKAFFKKKSYFGYGGQNIFFFSQQVLPLVDENGKIVLKAEGQIYNAPQGNGSLYEEIKRKKLVNHMEQNNIKYVFIGPTNNVLLKIADPTSLGYLISEKQKVVATCFRSVSEEFGYFGVCPKGNVKVYEHVVGNEKEKKWANSGSCYMRLDFIKRVTNSSRKMSQIINSSEGVIHPKPVYIPRLKCMDNVNCVFFETYYHDVFAYTNEIAILEVNPDLEIAPIKSTNGTFTLQEARQSYWRAHKIWAQNSGYSFKDEGHFQIAPSLTYFGQNLSERLKQRNIQKCIQLPAYIS